MAAAIQSSGRALDADTLATMETGFGRDLSGVRIHTDPDAQRSADAVNASAYTVGQDIVFARGQYSPASTEGKRLIAHEVAHTIQQSSAGVRLQRQKGNLPDLNSPRFAGDNVLEEVFDGLRVLRKGSKGEPVRKVQSALIDAGFPLPRFGADADYGDETAGAVRDFQRAAGLIASEIDGQVGENTLSRLDSRFPQASSTGTPAQCEESGMKTVTVDFIRMRGSTRSVATDLNQANQAFRQCCVKFQIGQDVKVPDADSDTLLGGDTDLQMEGCGRATAEELTLFNTVVARFGLNSRLKAFYVDTMTPRNQGRATSPLCATGVRAPLSETLVVEQGADTRTLGHELAHVIHNTFSEHSVNADNLQHISAGATGADRLERVQCDIIFARS